jgi:uncharacterized tellurite resistance protein B-like protein
MFGKQKETPTLGAGGERLTQVVRQHLPESDEQTIETVVAIAGLLATVAYADRTVTEEEERRLCQELERIHGLSRAGVQAICGALREHIVELSTAQAPRYTRALRELGDRDLRLEVLEVLVDLAAADGTLATSEVNVLRQLATALGLSQDDYNVVQARHRDKLSVLRS